MAKGCRSHHQTRHDLVADPQIQGRIKSVVRQCHPGGQSDHIAREQRKLHAWLALGHPVAHCRNPACNLHRSADFCRRRADDLGIVLIGLMGGQHIVIGRDNANVGQPCLLQSRFLIAHRGIGMGLIAAGQMPARGPRTSCRCDAGKVGGTAFQRAFTNTIGDAGDGGVQRHGPSGIWNRGDIPRGAGKFLSHCVSANKWVASLDLCRNHLGNSPILLSLLHKLNTFWVHSFVKALMGY